MTELKFGNTKCFNAKSILVLLQKVQKTATRSCFDKVVFNFIHFGFLYRSGTVTWRVLHSSGQINASSNTPSKPALGRTFTPNGLLLRFVHIMLV